MTAKKWKEILEQLNSFHDGIKDIEKNHKKAVYGEWGNKTLVESYK